MKFTKSIFILQLLIALSVENSLLANDNDFYKNKRLNKYSNKFPKISALPPIEDSYSKKNIVGKYSTNSKTYRYEIKNHYCASLVIKAKTTNKNYLDKKLPYNNEVSIKQVETFNRLVNDFQSLNSYKQINIVNNYNYVKSFSLTLKNIRANILVKQKEILNNSKQIAMFQRFSMDFRSTASYGHINFIKYKYNNLLALVSEKIEKSKTTLTNNINKAVVPVKTNVNQNANSGESDTMKEIDELLGECDKISVRLQGLRDDLHEITASAVKGAKRLRDKGVVQFKKIKPQRPRITQLSNNNTNKTSTVISADTKTLKNNATYKIDLSVLQYIDNLYKKGDDCETINGVMRLYDDKTQEELKHVLEKYDRMDKSGLTAEEREDYEMKVDDVRTTSVQMLNNNKFSKLIEGVGNEYMKDLLELLDSIDISQLARVFKEPYENVLKEAQRLSKTGKEEDSKKAYEILAKIKLIEGCENLVKYKVDDKIFEGKEVPDAIVNNMVRSYLEAIKDTNVDISNEKAIEKYLIDNVVRIDNNDYKEQEKIVKAALPYTKLYMLKYKTKDVKEATAERARKENEEKGVSFTITEKEIKERREGAEMRKMREMYEEYKKAANNN